jgi:2'-5' RNA ligase
MIKRIFIAINLPGEVKKELEGIQREIAQMFPEDSRPARDTSYSDAGGGVVRWVKKDNLHLTLLFMGYVNDGELPQICQIVKRVAQNQKSFSLRLEKVSYGPPKQLPPRLIWTDLEKKPELISLAEKLKSELSASGILRREEQRGLSPHITLGRIKTWQWRRIEPEERPEIDRELDLEFEVKSVEIMESKLRKSGSEYSVVQGFNFNVR